MVAAQVRAGQPTIGAVFVLPFIILLTYERYVIQV